MSLLLDKVGNALSATPAIVLVRSESGTPLMLVPLAETQDGSRRVLEFIDFGISDYNAPIIRRDFAEQLARRSFSPLWSRILERIGKVDAVSFRKMPSTIEGAPNPFTRLNCQFDMVAFNSPLTDGFAPYMKTLGSRMNGELRRTRRKLEAMGAVELRVASDPESAAALLKTTVEYKSAWCRATGAHDLIGEPAYAEFYDAFARQQVGSIAHTSALMVGDRMIAGNFGLVWRGRFYGLIQSSDFENYRVHSPGNHLLVEIIRWCCDNGIALFDFSIGSESYKGRWADGEEQLYRYSQAFTVMGMLFEAQQRARVEFKSKANPQLVAVLRNVRDKARALMPESLTLASRYARTEMRKLKHGFNLAVFYIWPTAMLAGQG
ncbi:GNAT family N-acetyltransferase [Microvirga sp. 2MCAF35]|uniref:GNAT family N-acetyltransferase n=1 Tax=Microvirga sp. 2MCAF35 TaxID=3232987 RepID=UPI003F9626E4